MGLSFRWIFENYHKISLAYIYWPHPLERGFAIWIYVIFHLIGGSFLCGCTLWLYTFRINLHICDYDWSSGGVINCKIKTPSIKKGFVCFSCGEYKIWTYASELLDDGLAIRCITTLPTLQCGGWGTRTPKAVRPAVFKTAVLPIRTNPPWIILISISINLD